MMRRSFDWDDLYIEYDELVEAGEIDPKKTPIADWVTDRYADLCADAFDRAKAAMRGE